MNFIEFQYSRAVARYENPGGGGLVVLGGENVPPRLR